MSAALTAPEAFRFTFDAAPDRHLRAATLLAPDAEPPADPAAFLPTVLADLMHDIGMPNGIAEVGYHAGDIDDLVGGALKTTAPARHRTESRHRRRPRGDLQQLHEPLVIGSVSYGCGANDPG
ncbi:iron-containing alcohol dehydrogenase [Fodinicola feengrottensis]|uniref:iron-containing alcohol dehydrogenase n=1 Tax=Fodinicola feengrottensis TaxID=435914 RepID=UPI0028BE5210|nr:iron-containing alcohol dehydrogenase [Fodinicola feengrottensis]